jgi:hypothetical protein
MNADVIKMALDGDYDNFSKSITSALKDKMAEHPISLDYIDKCNIIHNMKDQFKSVQYYGAVS